MQHYRKSLCLSVLQEGEGNLNFVNENAVCYGSMGTNLGTVYNFVLRWERKIVPKPQKHVPKEEEKGKKTVPNGNHSSTQ